MASEARVCNHPLCQTRACSLPHLSHPLIFLLFLVAFRTCDDPFFRSIRQVQLQQEIDTNLFVLSTVATCRDCPEENALFSNRFVIQRRRRRQQRPRYLLDASATSLLNYSITQARQLAIESKSDIHTLSWGSDESTLTTEKPVAESTTHVHTTSWGSSESTPGREQPLAQPTPSDHGTALSSYQGTLTRQKPIESDSCFCSAKNTNSSGVPSPDLFQQAYRGRINDIRNEDTLSSTPRIRQVVEVDEIQCSANQSSLETTILMSVLFPVDELTNDGRAAIASSFRRAYNEFIFSACDAPMFREALKVTIDDDSSAAWLGRQPFSSRLDRRRLLKLTVTYACRECGPGSTTMFDIPVGDGLTSFPADSFTGGGINQEVQSKSESCFCPVESFPDEVQATVHIFRDVYASQLGSDSIDEVREVEEYDCGTNSTNVDTILYVELDRDPKNISRAQSIALERRMEVVFNDISWRLCDQPLFRAARSFRFGLGGGQRMLEGHSYERRDQQISNSSRPQEQPEPGMVNRANLLIAASRFECRSCQLDATSMFSWDTPRVRLGTRNFSSIFAGEPGNLTDTCFCPVSNGRGLARSPTESEFIAALRRNTGRAIPGVRDLVEVKEVVCPTTRFVFQTEIYLRLAENATLLSETERESISGGFIEVYNVSK